MIPSYVVNMDEFNQTVNSALPADLSVGDEIVKIVSLTNTAYVNGEGVVCKLYSHNRAVKIKLRAIGLHVSNTSNNYRLDTVSLLCTQDGVSFHKLIDDMGVVNNDCFLSLEGLSLILNEGQDLYLQYDNNSGNKKVVSGCVLGEVYNE